MKNDKSNKRNYHPAGSGNKAEVSRGGHRHNPTNEIRGHTSDLVRSTMPWQVLGSVNRRRDIGPNRKRGRVTVNLKGGTLHVVCSTLRHQPEQRVAQDQRTLVNLAEPDQRGWSGYQRILRKMIKITPGSGWNSRSGIAPWIFRVCKWCVLNVGRSRIRRLEFELARQRPQKFAMKRTEAQVELNWKSNPKTPSDPFVGRDLYKRKIEDYR